MRRQRITITIKEDILGQVDRIVDGLAIRSRSHAIEYLLTKFLTDYRLKNALVLAGGDAMVSGKPKALAEINGKTVLEHACEKISSFGPVKIFAYTDFMEQEFNKELAKRPKDYNLELLSNPSPAGTIEPLWKAREKFDDTFLVAYGDTITSLNLNEMLTFHKKNNALATIALTTVSNPKNFGVATLEGNKIQKFVEKPKGNVSSYLVSAGYFLFEPRIFNYIGRDMKNIEKELFPKLAEKGLLFGYPFQGMYFNINSEQDLEKAKKLL